MKWLPDVRKFLHQQELWLELEEELVTDLQQERDGFIMDIILDSNFTSCEMHQINACWLYKGVTLIINIVDIIGMTICEEMIDSNKPITMHKGLMTYQACPNKFCGIFGKKFFLSCVKMVLN